MNILDIAIAKKLAGGGGGSGTDNYNDLSNLPKINDTTLSGNKSSSALGLQSEINSESKLASDLVDDTNQDNKFVTSTEKNTWNGKQNAIDADHKINADYVDDSTSTNKFVTASDKETWNAKQNAIDNSHKLSSDLVDDTNHTNKFVTSTEKQTWNAKQNAIDSDHKLSSSLVSFTTAEAAALASGIDSSKVGQISANQTNTSYALKKVGTNIANVPEEQTVRSITFMRNSDGWITSNASSDTAAWTAANANIAIQLEAKNYTIVWELSSDSNDDVELALFMPSGTQLFSMSATTSNRKVTRAFTVSSGDVGTFHIMYKTRTQKARLLVVETSVYNAYSEYQLYGAPNYDLTRLEAEDRASLAEVVDSGAKNKLKNNSYICTGSPGRYGRDDSLSIPAGDYVLIAKLNQVQNAALTLVWDGNQHDFNATGSFGNTIKTWNVHATNTITSAWVYFNGTNDTWTEVMLCTKAAFGVSTAFVPYRPNYDLVCNGLFPSEYTALQMDTKTSLISGGYCKIGNLVTVSARIEATELIQKGSWIVYSLPKPVASSSISVNSGFSAIVSSPNSTTAADVKLMFGLNTANTAGIFISGNSADMAAGVYTIFGSYLAK